MKSFVIDDYAGTVPGWFLDALHKVDDCSDHDGKLQPQEVETMINAVADMKKAKENNAAHISYESFPENIQRIMKTWDTDGSGTVGAQELAAAAEAMKELHRYSKHLKRAVFALILIVLFLAGAMFVTSLASAELAKDSRPDSQGIARIAGTDLPMAMASPQKKVKLTEIYDSEKYPLQALTGMKSVGFDTASGSHSYDVAGVNRRTLNGVTWTTILCVSGHRVQVSKWDAKLVYPEVAASSLEEDLATSSRRLAGVEQIFLVNDGQGRRLQTQQEGFTILSVTVQDQDDQGTLSVCDADKEVCEKTYTAEPSQKLRDDANFLIQATFGPTESDLAELSKTTHQAWLLDQMKKPVESHRAYFRERVNPRLDQTVETGNPTPPCEDGSRWFGHVFRSFDIDNDIIVSLSPDFGQVIIRGKIITDVDPNAVGGIYSNKDKFPAKVSSVEIDKNGVEMVTLSASKCKLAQVKCNKDNQWTIPNPRIWVKDENSRNDGADWTFKNVASNTESDAVIATSVGSCDGKDFVYKEGKFFRFDSRLELFTNSLEQPAKQPFAVACPTVKRNFLNTKHCQITKTCTPLNFEQKKDVTLDATSFEKFYRVEGKYIYSVTGLAPSTSPCGTLARWVKCSGCTATKSGDAVKDIVKALDGGSKARDVQDIDVSCTAADVPAGTIVKVKSNNFKHVHLHEMNVYDFSDWVDLDSTQRKYALSGSFSIDWQLETLDMEDWDDFIDMKPWMLGIAGETTYFIDLPTVLQTLGTGEAFDAIAINSQANPIRSGEYHVSCGSPFEVGSDPRKGHNLPMQIHGRHNDEKLETKFDETPVFGNFQEGESKVIVWIMKALQANDQLRQRMAWALSQFFVVSDEKNDVNEKWLTYYDIFVRNAFGNFKDILREVTYHPAMGAFLSYYRNTAFEYDNNYPDENYAREIMQLFSIGLHKLDPKDGTEVKTKDGDLIDTYDNENIMEFAKVFTGFENELYRSNIELGQKGTANKIDPMAIRHKWHDIYPKSGLDGNYLGDGYPLCAHLKERSFISKGAEYHFIGYYYAEDKKVYNVQETSSLFLQLCGASVAAECVFDRASITLANDLPCIDASCDEYLMDSVQVVKVGKGFFEYSAPACVYMTFFSDGRVAASSQLRNPTSSRNKVFLDNTRNKCMDPDTPNAGVACCPREDGELGMCQNNPPGDMANCDPGQMNNRKWKKKCTKLSGWKNAQYCRLTCAQKGFGYNGGEKCPAGLLTAWRTAHVCAYPQEQVRLKVAQEMCKSKGLAVCDQYTEHDNCELQEPRTWQNVLRTWTPKACTLEATYDMLTGKVGQTDSAEAKQNPFLVQWVSKDGKKKLPAPETCDAPCKLVTRVDGDDCQCTATVTTSQVFTTVPTKQELMTSLKIGALPRDPKDGAYHMGIGVFTGKSGIIDKDTVFEYPTGFFHVNQQSTVTVGKYHFRNPPRFSSPDNRNHKKASDEMESLLDHLFKHPNTAPFFCFRMIQRFTASNPSKTYIEDVVKAFKTGEHMGHTYSGTYGCLSATLAAILLHPEARAPVEASQGKLREPILKVVHFMRSMEYRDLQNASIIFAKLGSFIGQKPYFAPDVFNYYLPKYEPANFPPGLFGPEFQIFTAPWVSGFLNGMMAMLEVGVSTCENGFGPSRAGSRPYMPCKEGEFKWKPRSNTGAGVAEELDVILTGGSMSDFQKGMVAAAYDEGLKKKTELKLKAAQQTILMAPEFHTQGTQEDLGPRAVETPAVEPSYTGDYKAFIYVFLRGGADTFNMLAPYGDCKLADEYKEIRGVDTITPAGIEKKDLRPISATGQPCSEFGLHKNFEFLEDLYKQGQAGFLTNMGQLYEPMTRQQFFKGGARKCVGLFSHADQKNAGNTLTCHISGTGSKGAGGRMGDALTELGKKVTSFSTSGNAVWSSGDRTNTDVIDSERGAARFERLDEFRAIIGNITSRAQKNIYAEEYQRAFAYGVEKSEDLGKLLDAVEAETAVYKTDVGLNKLDKAFRQIARVIKTAAARKASRDFFFVSFGGFDMHNEVIEKIGSQWATMDEALNHLVTELKAQKVFDNVVLTTGSDFARTLTSNGKGTDHAWAGNYIVLGGKVKGKNVFNKYHTSLLKGNDQDIGRGRLIPHFPYENVFVPIAKWMGVTPEKLHEVFPNYKNFDNKTHILQVDDLFHK